MKGSRLFSLVKTHKRVYTVWEVVRKIKNLIENGMPPYLGVEGEISNLRKPSSGHIYFTLKDPFAQIKVVIFRENVPGTLLKDGMKVVVWGRIRIYEERGELELIGEKVQEQKGLGILYEEFLKLKKKLEKEGLFAPERKKPIPPYPRKIGIITSPTGAAIRDMIKIIHRRFPNVEILIYPVKVQGEEAPHEIVEGLQILNRLNEVEVIILGRGGGSLEDLWAFNEEIVARAIASSKIPVISAVGHETDYCISDFVADLRAPTPSAAAELVVKEMEKILSALYDYRERLEKRILQEWRRSAEKLLYLKKALLIFHPFKELERKRENLCDLTEKLFGIMENLVSNKREETRRWGEKLNALSPLKVLERGYSITFLLPERKILRSSEETEMGDRVEVKLWKGKIFCRVEEKDESPNTV
ncbi:exodeoxyribonuclease VII large subunit [Candidatus Calescamantes bacterium]|nr:exodeoxyribonuclease VII large subunit [Candidatus Calescamantes bacterium]